jgi:pre-mRNA-splicing factor ATP-dependent RNA helicase DHX16
LFGLFLSHQNNSIKRDLENEENDMLVLQSFLCGFYRNVALLNQSVQGKRGTYRTLGKAHLDEVTIHPSSVLAGVSSPPLAVVFSELVVTSKHYVRDCSAVGQKWLVQCVPQYFVEQLKKE